MIPFKLFNALKKKSFRLPWPIQSTHLSCSIDHDISEPETQGAKDGAATGIETEVAGSHREEIHKN